MAYVHAQHKAAWFHSGKAARRPSPEPGHAGALALGFRPPELQ